MSFLDQLFQPSHQSVANQPERLFLALLVAFIIGQFNSWCYKYTHRGVSYSRTFAQALVLITITAAISMSLISTNMIAAVGLLGGLAIVRFRTVVRDARDTSYIFLCLICGMAAGFGYYGIVLIGGLATNAIALYMHGTGFGASYGPDSLLRFRIATSAIETGEFRDLLQRFCRRWSVISVDESSPMDLRSQPECLCAYRIRLRDPDSGPDLVSEMKQRFGVEAVHLLVEQEFDEIA